MPILPVTPWSPDSAPLSGGTTIALNVMPRTKTSYGPYASMQPISNALDGKCIGAISATDQAVTPHLFAGTPDKLYRLDSATWIDVSAYGYAVPPGEWWRFLQFKNMVLATNIGNNIQALNMASGTFADLSPDAPRARFIASVKGAFCMVGNTWDPVGGFAPWRVWWPAVNDPTNWPAPGSSTAQAQQSDYNDFAGPDAQLTGLVAGLGNADVGIFFTHGIWSGLYAGPPDVFDFHQVEGSMGTRASGAIVQVGPIVYYLGEDGFYAFDGATSTQIGFSAVDRWFWDNADPTFAFYTLGSYDAVNRAIRWVFPSKSSGSTVGNLIFDMEIIFIPTLNRWSHAANTVEWITQMVGLTGDFANRPVFAAVDIAHKLNLFTGPPLAAQVSSQELQPFPTTRAFVNNVRPLVDGTSPTVAIATRNRLEDAQVWGADISMTYAGNCPQRAEGRFLEALVKMPAGVTWTHMQGVDATAVPSGMR